MVVWLAFEYAGDAGTANAFAARRDDINTMLLEGINNGLVFWYDVAFAGAGNLDFKAAVTSAGLGGLVGHCSFIQGIVLRPSGDPEYVWTARLQRRY